MRNVGVLGAGQLALMLNEAAKLCHVNLIVYAPTVSQGMRERVRYIEGNYSDTAKLDEFLAQVDVVTVETESLPLDVLQYIEKHHRLLPNTAIIEIAQDRLKEKNTFCKLNIPTNQFMPIDSLEDCHDINDKIGFPLVIKQRRFSYDGKGQKVIHNMAELQETVASLSSCHHLAESMVEFDSEVSIIAARNAQGECVYYPLCENTHKQGILRKTRPITNPILYAQATDYAAKLLESYDYVGVLTVEFFVKDTLLIANEIAPRVHNSGHWTIEGTCCSQFENHLRAVSGQSLMTVENESFTLMYNLIGEIDSVVDSLTDVYFHPYFKTPKPNRKLGHVTVHCRDANDLEDKENKYNSLFL